MKTALFLTLSLFLVNIVSAQNQDWRPIRTDDTYFYFGNDGYHACRIDSIEEYPDSTIMYSFPELFASYYSDCFNPFGPSWIGKKIECLNNKTTIYNILNKPITLLYTTEIGSKWHLYDYSDTRYIQAEIIGKTLENIGYIEDSVISIELSSDDQLNGSQITVSKNHGIVQGFNFLLFPELSTEFQQMGQYTQTGQVSNTTSIGNITAFDVYNFEIGDVFHTNYYSYDVDLVNNTVNTTDEKYIQSVVEKSYNKDSSEVTYTFNQCDRNGEHLTSETILLYDEMLEYLPFQSILSDDEYSLIFNQMGIHSNGYRYKDFGGGYMYYEDSCYNLIAIDKKKSTNMGAFPYVIQEGLYIEGLGGPYYSHGFMFSGESYRLVYYKKGSTQWGTPYNCEDLVSTINTKNNLEFKLYPNPANNQITIETPAFKVPMEIVFIDLFGKVCLKTEITKPLQSIDINSLSHGLYVYQILCNGESVIMGKFVKN